MNQPNLSSALTQHTITVLLVDDQLIVGEAVRRMLATEEDIDFHFCQDPTKAVATALEIGPTIILQDLVMPEIDGLTLVKFFRANPPTRDVPIIVLSTKEEATTKAEAFALGASDYLVKLPDKIELVARIRHHSAGYINLLQRNEAYQRLTESQKILAEDLAQASQYVTSLLPPPLDKGSIAVDWRFVPSATLGGDTFGYHWLDDEHFAFYLLDVCGHGVKAALLSVSAVNVLRSQSLPDRDFRNPADVLAGLNQAFPMERQFEMYFTIWYGIIHKSTRKLTFAGGGHPAALLLSGPSKERSELKQLESQGPVIGAFDDMVFENTIVDLGTAAKVFLFSDGVFEIHEPATQSTWPYDEFLGLMTTPATINKMDELFQRVKQLRAADVLDDDFSILQLDC